MKVEPIPGDVLKSFDSIIILLNDLAAEAVSLKEKFGDRSKLYQAKLAQIETIRIFYTKTKGFIEKVVEHNTRLGVECIGLQIQLTQELHAMSFGQAAETLGLKFSPEFIKMHDQVDEIIKNLRTIE